MREVLSILFSAILLTSGIQVSIDRHYCHGELADVSISISGKSATCGMEAENHSLPGTAVFSGKCCEDQVIILNLDSGYYPVSFLYNFLTVPQEIPFESANELTEHNLAETGYFSSVLPPDRFLPQGPEQADLCLFRI